MMSQVHHDRDSTVVLDAGFDAALTTWLEPENLAKVGFFRSFRSFVMCRGVYAAFFWATFQANSHWNLDPNPVGAADDLPTCDTAEIALMESNLRLAWDMDPHQDFDLQRLQGLVGAVLQLELEISGESAARSRAGTQLFSSRL
jgi:hypothetical protein